MKPDKKQLVQQISESNMLALQNGQRADSATEQFAELAQQLQAVAQGLSESGLGEAADLVVSAVERISQLPSEIAQVVADADNSAILIEELQQITNSINSLQLDPKISVSPPQVNVAAPDFKPLLNSLDELKKAQKKEDKLDIQPLIDAVSEVKKSISSLSFPVPNYVLPFSSNGKAAQVVLDSSGNVPVAATFTPSGTQDTNLKQVGGTTVDTNSGSKSAGTQRIVIATDQPQLTNALKVDGSAVTQPVSGTFWQATQPVSGTVIANAGTGTMDVSNAGLTELAAAINASSQVDVNIAAGNITGFATSAKQDTAQTALDAIKTATETIDNAISGSEMQVDVVGALPAGTNAIGKLAANSGVDIGDVDVTSVIPGSGATNLGKAEDGASADGDVGVAGLAVRKAAPANTSGTDGDYEFLQMSAGRQWVWAQPNVTTISTTITRPGDTNAYAANDAFANSTSAPTSGGFTLTGAALVSGGTGIITDAVISASAGTAYNGELWIFDQAVTATNDNAALSVSDSDVQNLVGIIPFQTTDVNAANSVSYVTGLNIGYTCVGTANLRFLVKIMSAVTPGNAEVLSVRVKVTN